MAQPAFKGVLNTEVFLWLSKIVHHRAMTHASWLVRVLLAPVLAGGSILGWPFCFTADNFSLLASFNLSFAGFCEHVRIQPSSSRLFSLPLVSGDFRIQAGNSMNQSELITNTCSPFQQAREIARERVLIGLSLTYNYIANRSFFTVRFLLFTSQLRRC